MQILMELGGLGALIFLIMLFKFKIYLPWPRKQYLRQQSLILDTFIYTHSGMLVLVLLIVGFGHGIIIRAYYLPSFLGMRAGAMQSLHRGKMLLGSTFTSITQLADRITSLNDVTRDKLQQIFRFGDEFVAGQ